MKRKIIFVLVTAIAVSGLAAAAGKAGAWKLKGTITADGSSTVGPYTIAAGEAYHKKYRGVNVTVGISGTGGGFERFCRGEIDLADASRPIKPSERQKCVDAGVGYIPFTVANDGIAIVVNKKNTWAKCLTVAELKKMWEPGSKVNNWKDVNPSFPDQSLKLFGAGTDSGTFDFFTEKINGKSRASRTDYFPSENDNVIVQGVSGEKGALGYFGLSYYESNMGKLNLVKVNAGGGCVAPSIKTVQAKTYKPLSRPLFIYAKNSSFKRREVRGFIGYILRNERAIAKRSRFVSLTNAQLELARDKYRVATKR